MNDRAGRGLGGCSIHTPSLKMGKLRHGEEVTWPRLTES